MPELRIARTDASDPAVALPAYETASAAGADLRANLAINDRDKGIILAPGARTLVPTGLIFEIPVGFEVQLRPRSGLALKHGVTLANAPGTIDADYRGEVGVILINLGDAPFAINHGDRIAQAVIAPMLQAQYTECDTLTDTTRGAGGFGSTGAK